MTYFLLLLLCISTLSTPQEISVCFSDSGCGVGVERPVFYLGTSFDDCCAMPDVLSVLTDNCVACILSADRVTPLHVALYPPDSILLEVTATGYDTISWFINGTVMHDFDHLLLEDYNKKLTIINTTVDDYGIYSADIHTLQNDFEVVEIDFYVYKYVSPNVELSTPSENEIENKQLNLTCSAVGNPVPSISVYCDNITILSFDDPIFTEPEQFGSLPINSQTVSVIASDADGINQCHCNATAYDGTDIETKTVSAQILPVSASILSFQYDQSFSVIAPLKIELSCMGKGRPVPSVTWYKGENEITSNNDDDTVSIKESISEFVISSNLTITNSSSSDYGLYHCGVSNLHGAENSTTVLIDVQIPSNVTVPNTLVEVNVNIQKEVSFHCESVGNPEPQIIWLGDGGILNNNCGTQGSLGDNFGEAALDYDQFYSGNAQDNIADGYVPKNCEIQITRDDSVEGIVITNSTLIIRELDLENIQLTSFRCIAENNVANLLGVMKHIKIVLELEDYPYFLRNPLDYYNILYTSSATFNCDVIGQSSMIITWLKDGIALSEQNDTDISITSFSENVGLLINSTLTIVTLDSNDAGKYTCQAQNNEGVSQYNFTVDIYGALTIHDNNLTAFTYTVGETLVISCNITSKTAPVISWIHQGITLSESNNIFINNNEMILTDGDVSVISTLMVSELEITDDGLYECQAMDEQMTVEQNIASVTINVPVTAIVNPNTSIHFNQTTTTINCTASGIPAPTVQFINVICNDEELGEAAEAEESGDFSVYCIYQLQSDGVFTVTAMAVITTVSTFDPIELFCSSENSISTANDTGLIIVQAVPVIISTTINNIDVVVNQSFFLSCNASGYPAPSVVWTLDNDVLTNNGSVITTDDSIALSNGLQYVNSVLTINNATFDDEGVYMCSFSNDAGTNNLTIATVDIRVPSLITVSYETITTLIGSSESLYCNASGFPAPVISWFKSDILINIGSGNSGDNSDTSPLVEIIDKNDTHNIITTIDSTSDDIVYTFSELIIETVQLSDEGLYSCRVWNEFGDTIINVGQLIVEEPPNIYLSQSVTYTVLGDDDTTIFCTGTGKPQPSVTFGEQKCSGQSQDYIWNGVTITCGSSNILNGLPRITSTITLTPLISFFGELNLTCLVENGLSPIASGMVTVNVEVDKTVLITPNDITVNESDSIVLLCEATGYPLPSIDWIIGGESVIENERLMINTQQTNAYTIKSTLTLSNIEPDDEEIYKCRAESIGSFLIDSSSVQVIEIDECMLLQDLCVNGTCQDGLKGYTCVCDEGFSGTNCDTQDVVKDPVVPVVTENPPNITEAFLLGEINITCYATGDPEPTIYWYKDDEIVDDVIGSELIITEAKPSDRGYYHCEAVNDGGNETSDPGLVKIQGITQYVSEIGTGSVFDDQDTVEKMVNCLTSEYITGSNKTIIYSLEYCTALGCQHDGVAAILLTLYQTRMPYSTQGLRNALSNKLEDINTDCDTNVIITDVWRFDGCRETREIFRANLSLSILWAESEIAEETVNPCPCGSLTSSVYTNSTTSRKCGGDYTNGGVWLDSDTSSCDYNELNENITLTLCHLTEVYVASELASSLESITEDASIFQSLDFTIASLVLENLALSQDIKSDQEIQEKFVQSISNLMFVNIDIAVDSQRKHDSTSRILRAIDRFQTAIDLPTNTTMTQFVTENVAFHMLETSSSNFVNMTFQVNLKDYDSINNNGITIDYRQNVSLFNSSLSVPENVLEGRTGAAIDEPIRVSYAVFLRDILFQESPGSVYGSRIAANNLTVGSIIVSASLSSDNQIINITDLVTPIVIKFRKPESFLLNSSESHCVFWDDKNSDQSWSSEGCVLVDISNDDIVSCECNHLTHFGYLLDVQPSDNQPDDLLALEIIIYILCILSIICLIIVVFTYASSKKLRFHAQGKTIINMALALIGVYTCYMVAVNAKAIRDIEGIRGDILCGFFGALLYYFLLVYFMWTGLEAIDLYRKLVRVFNKENKHFVIYGGIFCWGVPLIITAIATTAGREDYIQYEYFCRPVGPTFYVSFLVPFGLIYLFNWIIFIIIVAKLISRRAQKSEYTSSHGLDYRKIFFVAMILSVNFGLGWIFGLLVTSQYPEPLYITFIVIFSLFVGFQGILIFFLHCIRNQNARQTWRIWFYVLCCCENVRNAQTLSNSTHTKTSGMTPAMRRKNYNVPENSSEMKTMPSLAQKYFTSSVVESETGNIDSPLHESDTNHTMETCLGADNLASPTLDMTNIFDFTTEDEKFEMRRMSKASSKTGFRKQSKISTSGEERDLMGKDVKKKRWSKQESRKSLDKKKLSKKNSKKTTRVEKLIENEEIDEGSFYSLGSQVLEIQYKPTIGEEDSDDEEAWQKLHEQFQDVNKMINSSFFDKNQSAELNEVLY